MRRRNSGWYMHQWAGRKIKRIERDRCYGEPRLVHSTLRQKNSILCRTPIPRLLVSAASIVASLVSLASGAIIGKWTMALQMPFGSDFFADLFSSLQSVQMDAISTCLQGHSAVLGALPAAYANLSAVLINNNLAVIPGDWQSGPISRSSLYKPARLVLC